MVEKNMEDLDALLLRRHAAPPPRSNLSERIIEASLQAKPKKMSWFEQWFGALLENFVLPRPAYALAAVMVLGIAIGLFYQMPLQESDSSYLDAYFLYMDDVLPEEAWL